MDTEKLNEIRKGLIELREESEESANSSRDDAVILTQVIRYLKFKIKEKIYED